MRRTATVVLGCVIAFVAIAPTAAFAFWRSSSSAAQAASSATLSAPTNLRCTNVNKTQITLNWDAVAGISPSKISYAVQRKIAPSNTWNTVADGIQTTSYHESVPVLLGTVSYQVVATMGSWGSPSSDPLTATFTLLKGSCSS